MQRPRRAGLGATALATLALTLGACSADADTQAPAATAIDPTHSSSGPTTAPAEKIDVSIASLKGPTTIGLVGLMQEAQEGTGNEDYAVTMYGAPDEIVPLLVQGKVDIALIPSHLAAVLYNQTTTDAGPALQVAAINTLGVLEIVESGTTVHTWADLAGRTIYTTGKGTTPEFVLDYLLTRNGLDPDTDVTVDFVSEATELAAKLAATPGTIAVLPQPFATVVQAQNPDVHSQLSLSDEWTKVAPAGSELITGVLVVRTAFAEENPEALAAFLADYQASTRFANTDPVAAGALVADAGIVSSAALAAVAIPACHITYLVGDDMVTALDAYLEVLFDAAPASVGGSMPGDGFYYRP